MNETWRPIRGFEHTYYQVSDQGRVRNLTRILKPWLVSYNGGRQGQLVISLGRAKRARVCHLVLDAFVGPRPEGAIARHLDDDPSNNRLDNLVWGSHSENSYDAVRNGRHGMTKRTHCKCGAPLDGTDNHGRRFCTTCKNERGRDYKKRKREGGPINPPGRPRKVSGARETETSVD